MTSQTKLKTTFYEILCWSEREWTHRLIYLSVWFPGSETIWEGRGVTLLEEPSPVSCPLSLPCICGSDVSSQLLP